MIAKEKFLVITLATPELAHYYEVVLDKIQRQDNNVRPALSAADIDKILDIAEEIDEEENMWDEEATNVIGGHIIDSKKLH